MNNINKILTAFLLLIITQSLFSQAENFGTWTTIGIEKKVNKWDFGAETELRTVYYVRLIERWSLGVSADYNINKPIKVGVGYDLMSKLDTKYLNYQMRNRMNVFVSGRNGCWLLAAGLKLQATSLKLDLPRTLNFRYWKMELTA